ncbi:MAG: hypothetical protein WBC44_16525 [Planctomycetaceae bacterium]
MSSPPSWLPARWPIAAALVGLLLFAVVFYGCDSRRVIVVEQTEIDAGDACASLLDNALDMARPTSLGLVGIRASLQSTPNAAAEQFSQWLRRKDCQAASPSEPLTPDANALLTRLLGEKGMQEILSNQADPFDAGHVRDALLAYAAVDNLARDAENDLDRIMLLFGDVVRTITPQGAGTTEVPLTAYEAQLFGRGTAENRATLFANLLRQLRIDAVVIRPAADGESAASEADPWWVGVLLEDGVYLFDTALGLPVPAEGLPSSPAAVLPTPTTWSHAIENPGLLVDYRSEAGLETTLISEERLKSPRIELIGPRSFWSKAMERLELSMSGDRGVLLYDPLHDTQAGPGLVRRVVEAGGSAWNEDAISIWLHTEHVREARSSLSESQRQRLEQRLQPFLGPVEAPEANANVVAANRRLWQTRLEHMSGRPGSAIGTYLRVRDADTPNPLLSPADRALNRQAADEAHYWSAQAQFSMGDYAAAVETIDDYLAQEGDRSDEARSLRVLSLAAQGEMDAAVAAVEELPETTPGLARFKWLASKWTASDAKPAAQSEP